MCTRDATACSSSIDDLVEKKRALKRKACRRPAPFFDQRQLLRRAVEVRLFLRQHAIARYMAPPGTTYSRAVEIFTRGLASA